MRATLALIRFELERRRLALTAAPVVGLLCYLMPLLPGLTHRPPNELRTVIATITAGTYSLLFAFALGSTLVAADLAERRAGFFFARPLGGLQIAAARYVAALTILVGGTLLVLLPSFLAGAPPETAAPHHELIDPGTTLVLFFGAVAALVLLTSAVVLAARARTAWVVFELTALVVAGLTTERGYARLHDLLLPRAELVFWLIAAAGAVVAMVAVYAAAMTSGRTDLARAHRAQALVGGSLILLAAFAGLLWANDYVSPRFDEIREGSVAARWVGGDLFEVMGSEVGRDDLSTRFLFDGRSGRWHRTGQTGERDPLADARIAGAQGESFYFTRENGELRLERIRPSASGFEVKSTAIVLDRLQASWTISGDGSLLARLEPVGDASLLVVQEVATGRLLRSTRLPKLESSSSSRLQPESDGFRLVVSLGAKGAESWRVERDGTARRTAAAPARLDDLLWFLDPERSRLFVRSTRETLAWSVFDAATLAPIAELRPALLTEANAILSPILVRYDDGSVLVTARAGDRREIDLYSESGELLHTSTWPVLGPTTFLAAGARRTILLGWKTAGANQERAAGWSVERYDLERGVHTNVARDLTPLATPLQAKPSPALLRDDDGRLYSLDSDSGELRPLAPSIDAG